MKESAPQLTPIKGESATAAVPAAGADLTIFVCGPSKCEHDYSAYQDIIDDGRVVGETVVCSKCGRTAYDEAAWAAWL